MKFLNKINNYSDFKKINKDNYNYLADEIRNYIIELSNQKDIHLSSNLGIIELTLSLSSYFNLDNDILIYDTGHQSYVHKLITGRYSKFKNIRGDNGIAGLLDMSESKYDHYSPGHCSNSLSILQGYYLSNINQNDKYYICVVGDSAFTNGLFLEALNHVSYRQDKLIIVINDNGMSISEAVGGINSYLSNLKINYDLEKSNNLFFKNLGFEYIGKVDGHNLEQLEKAFLIAKQKVRNKPTIVHVKTIKGNGLKDAIEDRCGVYHSKTNKKSNSFGEEISLFLKDEIIKNNKIKIINPAMNVGSGFLEIYKKSLNKKDKFYNKYFDVGINEEHSISLSSGLSIKNNIVFLLIYSTFLQRGYDQLLHDVARLKLKLNLLIDRADLSAGDGPTHHGIFDVGLLNSIPNTIICSPRNYDQLIQLTKISLDENIKKIFAIRYPRNYSIEFNNNHKIKIYQSEIMINNNSAYCIISYGPTINQIANIIIEQKININLINSIFINELDKTSLKQIFKNKKIFCYERVFGKTGLYSLLVDYKNLNNLDNEIYLVSFNSIPYFGNLETLNKDNKMDLEYLFNFIKNNI